jgi:hypothetical protein
MVEHTKITPIYESNPRDSVETPTYMVSRQVGTIVEELPEESKEEIPRYVVSSQQVTDVINNTNKENVDC